MADFYVNGKLEERKEPHTVFTVYGDFTEPIKNECFFVVRIPSGRQPWSKKIAPAINKLVKSFGNKKAFWNVDGEHSVYIGKNSMSDGTPIPPTRVRLWETRMAVRYDWNGTELVRIP